MHENLKEFNHSFSFLAYESEEPNILDFTGPFSEREKYAGVKSYYKNEKAFFEKNEKEQLKEALENLTKPDAQSYVEAEKESLTTMGIRLYCAGGRKFTSSPV